jgi:hypothetical protein
MSIASFQNALALLIRLPEANRSEGTTETFLASFELSQTEIGQLRALASDPLVQKFGRIMRGARFEGLVRQLKILGKLLPHELIERIDQLDFEPTAAKTTARFYPLSFCEWLLETPKALAAIENVLGEITRDIVKYEHAQLLFRRQVLDRNVPTPGTSLLKHLCFQIIRTEFDVAEFLKSRNLSRHSEQQPILFIGELEVPDFRTFAINETMAQALEKLRTAFPFTPDLTADEMTSLQELVAVKLIKTPEEYNQ